MPDFLQQKTHFDYHSLNAEECLNMLSEDEIATLINHKTDIEFKAGETIIKRGVLVSNILYVNEGLVKLEFVNDNKWSTLTMVHPHSFIGLICCFAYKIL